MLKVMIVEDEPVIRNGIANALDWASLDCVVVALAENGQDALEKIEACVPNIIISDIMMPEMDGLELSDRLLSLYSGIKIILLTGYKEFDYVKQAIRMGVSNYILKPTDPDELEAAIREVAKEIRSRISLTQETEKLRDITRQSKAQLKDKFLYDLMFRPLVNTVDLSKKMEYYGISANPYRIIGIGIDSFCELERFFTEEDKNILLFLIRSVFDEVFEVSKIVYSAIMHDRIVYAQIDSSNCEKKELEELLNRLCKEVLRQGKFSVSAGVSEVFEKFEDLRHARKQVDKCLEQRVFIGDNQIVFYNSIMPIQDESEEQINIQNFVKAVECGEGILEEARNLCIRIESSTDVTMARNAALQAVLLGVMAYCKNYGKIDDLFDPPVIPLEKITHAITLSLIAQSFIEIVTRIDTMMNDRMSKRYLQAIKVAKKYTEENYNKEINLEMIASRVYMSQWYFSKIFKRITGKPFTNYLSEVRIAKAKEIIAKYPELKNYEVAEMVGLISVRYFSELFKKIAGTTPSDFRSKCR